MGELELSSLEKTMRYHVEREFESHLPKLVRLDLKLFYIIITNYVNKSPTCVLIGFSNKYLCWHRVTGQDFYEDKRHMLKISRNTQNGVDVKFGKSIRVVRNYFPGPFSSLILGVFLISWIQQIPPGLYFPKLVLFFS